MTSGIWTFNTKDGYCEALVRGLRKSFLTPEDYRRLCLAENLEDLRSVLDETDYAGFLQDEPLPLAVTTISEKCRAKMASEFQHLRAMANYPLVKFLDFIVAEKMIDNIIRVIQGTINKKDPQDILAKIDPLGWTSSLRGISTLGAGALDDLYKVFLMDTPVGPYFERYFNSQISSAGSLQGGSDEVAELLNEQDLELMRSSLKKEWLEDFYQFCISLGGSTERIMSHILKSEADFRVLTVTLNTINTPLGSSSRLEDRNSLYPSFGYLYPDGTDRIRRAWNDVTVRAALEPFPKYIGLYDRCKDFYTTESGSNQLDRAKQQRDLDRNTSGAGLEPSRGETDGYRTTGTKAAQRNNLLTSIEDLLFCESVEMCELAFEEQFHYGVFYAWVKLKEQEIRNIVWLAEMILMQRQDQMDAIIPLFKPRI